MNRLFFIGTLVCVQFCIFAQDFTFDKSSSPALYMPIGITQSPAQKAITLDKIKNVESYLSTAEDLGELYWLHTYLAALYYIISDTENVIFHAEKGNRYNRDKYCKEYITEHVSTEEGDHPFQAHYLDEIGGSTLGPIKKYCIDNYKKAELYKRKKRAEEKEMAKANSKYNKEYYSALEVIIEADQRERKVNGYNDEQIRLDGLNRIALDSLYTLYGFPYEDLVSRDGTNNAFMVMHHSKNCEWNKKWTPRFLANLQGSTFDTILSFFFYRNFNEEDGICKSEKVFIKELKMSSDSTYARKMLDFTHWDKQFKK